MNSFKSHFAFTKGQQNGIFLLVLIIIMLQLLYFFVDFSGKEGNILNEKEMEHFQQKIDSIKTAKLAKKDSISLRPFNPNFLTDYQGYILGLTPEEIDRIQNYHQQNKWVNSPDEFQRITGVSDSMLRRLIPYFKFPDWVSKQNSNQPVEKRLNVEKKDLNTAEVEDLLPVKGIGEVLARRIVNYRAKIGGFLDDIQLKDIWGLDVVTRNNLLEKFTVKTRPEIKKINLNTAGALELSEVPYLDYELASSILDYRKLHERIDSFEDLAKITDFPSDKIDRIKLYLTLD